MIYLQLFASGTLKETMLAVLMNVLPALTALKVDHSNMLGVGPPVAPYSTVIESVDQPAATSFKLDGGKDL